MTTRPQTLRSSTTGNIPAAGTRLPGELWLNFADFQLGMIDAARNAQKLVAVRYFQTTANYAVGDFVIQGGALYVANQAVTAGAFSALQWTKIATASDIPGAYVLPTASTSVLGGVRIDGTSITIASGVISSTPSAPYVLPPASTTVLGGVKVDGTTIKAAGDGTLSTAAPPTNPNRLDNGDMWVDQHNSGASVAPFTGVFFGPDRWTIAQTKAHVTFGQNYNGLPKCPGFAYFLGAQVTSAWGAIAATDYAQIWQVMESDTTSDLMNGTANAQPCTLSFWVCSSVTGAFSVTLSGGNTTTNRAYMTTYNIPTANVWTKISVIIPGDISALAWATGNAGCMVVAFDLGSGSSYRTSTLNQWINGGTLGLTGATGSVSLIATLNAKFAVTGVKLEAGNVATPYPVEDLARKLARCQRYFIVYPSASIDAYGAQGAAVNETFYFPVPMRAAPTAVYGTPSYLNASGLAGQGADKFNAWQIIIAASSGRTSAGFTAALSAEI